jgi:hypothetical protein
VNASGYRAIDAPWHETRIVNCELCGQMLSRRAYHDARADGHRFCSPECAEPWLGRQAAPIDGPPSGSQ